MQMNSIWILTLSRRLPLCEEKTLELKQILAFFQKSQDNKAKLFEIYLKSYLCWLFLAGGEGNDHDKYSSHNMVEGIC